MCQRGSSASFGLSRTQRFEVVDVTRAQLVRFVGSYQLNSSEALPHDLLDTLRKELAVDAVMFVDLTSFSPYPPLLVGLRAKLTALEDGKFLWNFDVTFSAADPTVVNAARRFALGAVQTDTPVDVSRGALQSPSRFIAYAASTAFATLPPR